jgi:hypothetical protein
MMKILLFDLRGLAYRAPVDPCGDSDIRPRMDACSECASFPNISVGQTSFDDTKLMSADGGIWDSFLAGAAKPLRSAGQPTGIRQCRT